MEGGREMMEGGRGGRREGEDDGGRERMMKPREV